MKHIRLALPSAGLMALFLAGCATQPTVSTGAEPIAATPSVATTTSSAPARATPVSDPINDPLIRDNDNGGGGGGGGGGGPGGGGGGSWG